MKVLPIISVCGGSCSGKTIFAKSFPNAFVLSMDHFYVGKKHMKADKNGLYDFDAPDSVNIEECAAAAISLAQGKKTTIPFYDMKLSERTGTQEVKISPHHKFIVIEGLFSFYEPIKNLAFFKIFLDTPREIRVARRMLRDQSKGRSDLETLSWSIVVEKNHAQYVEPMKKYADLIIPFSYNPVSFS